MKYSEETINKICGYIEEGSTQKDACAKAGVSTSQFHEWLNTKPEFAERIKKAHDAYNEWENNGILIDAKRSLRDLIRGKEVEDVTIELIPDPTDPNKPRRKKETRKKKFIPPNPTAVIFALVNRDPEHWKNRINTEVKADIKNDEPKMDLSKVPDELVEEALKYIRGEGE